MDLRTILSATEKDMMRRYIECNIENHHGEQADIDYILRCWNESKQDLFKIFGGQFILEREVELEEPNHIVSNRLSESSAVWQFLDGFYSYICKCDREGCYNYHQWALLTNLITYDRLAENVFHFYNSEVKSETFIVEGKKIVLQEGTKITRFLKKFSEAAGIDGYEEFRIAHSMILNTKKMRGILCLSIHPLDYMTMSDNASTWTSCMSWKEHGCYRQGTVEMMNSKVAIVAYLKSNERDFTMPGNYIWNNKKWRSLFIVDEDVICNVKAYPYQSNDLVRVVDEWLLDLVKKSGLNREYCETYERIIPWEDKTYGNGNSIRFCFETDAMYNDIEHDDTIKRFGFVGKETNSNTTIFYSGNSECMWCGSTCGDFETEEWLVCWDCYEDERPVCPICGEHFYEEDGYYLNDDFICPCCYDTRTVEDVWHKRILAEDANEFVLCTDDYSSYYTYAKAYEYKWGDSTILTEENLNLSKIKVYEHKDSYHDGPKTVFFIPIGAIKHNYIGNYTKIFSSIRDDGTIREWDDYTSPLDESWYNNINYRKIF